MCGRMLQLIRLVVSPLQSDKDAEVVLPRADLDRCAGKLGADLVKPAGVDALLGTVDPKGTDGWVMRGLLGQVGYPHGAGRVFSCLWDRDRGCGLGVAGAETRGCDQPAGFDAGSTASGNATGGELFCADPRRIVFGFPVALQRKEASASTSAPAPALRLESREAEQGDLVMSWCGIP